MGANGGRPQTIFIKMTGSITNDQSGHPSHLPYIGRARGVDVAEGAKLWDAVPVRIES